MMSALYRTLTGKASASMLWMLMAMLWLWPQQSFAALDVEYSVFGAYSLSADAGGNASGPTYTVQVQKPANATVHRAFLIVAPIINQPAPPANALTLTIGGTNFTPNMTQTRTSASTNPITTRFDDVTASIGGALNALPTGTSNITVRENIGSNSAWDGSALLVIWNDPAVTRGVVAVKLGAERTDINPSLTLNTAPIDTSAPGLRAELGIGVSFSTGTGSQISNLSFEGTQLTSTLGGFDDGSLANGALITLGGIGDTSSRADNDERYDVTDLLTQNDTQLNINVSAVNNDDYLFAIWFEGRGIRGQVTIQNPVDNGFFNVEPAYSGTATPPLTPVSLTWRDDMGVVVSTTTVITNLSGAWSAPPQGLADGRYTLTASITNLSGTFTDTAIFTIDTVAPTIALTNPADNTVSNDATPTINGAVEAGAAVTVTIRDNNGMVVQTLLPTVMGTSWTIDAAALADGDYTVTASATDAAGNTATAGPHAFTIDTTPPAISIVAPANNSLTNDSTPAISGATESSLAVTITIRNNSNVVVQTLNTTSDAVGDWTIDATALADGAYTVTASATDAAGNPATAGPNAFIVDTTAPAVTLTAPANGSATNDTTPTISGTVEAAATVTVTIRDNNNAVVQTLNPAVMGTSWTIDAAALADGAYTVTAVATDAAGNPATAGPNTFTVDTVDPTVVIAAPANNSATNDTTPTISGTSEPGANVTVTVTDINGTTVFTGAVTTNAQGRWTINSSALAQGSYTVGATAVDAANNSGIAIPVTFTVDTTAPTVTLATPADNSASSNNSPLVSGTAEAGSSVVVTIRDNNNAVIQTLNPIVDMLGNWNINAAVLADGTYTATAVATDAAGNTATAGPNTFTVDTTAPAITIANPADGSSTSDNTPTIDGAVEAGATVDVTISDINGMVVQTLAVAFIGASWDVTALALPDGVYTAVASATDAVGNAATATSTFSVDTTAPTVTISTPADNSFIASVRPDISGTTEPGATVVINVTDNNGAVVHTATVTADAMTGAYTTTVGADLIDGAYSVDVTATDAAGNSGSASSTFNVDTTVLPLDITSPTPGSALSNSTPDVVGTTDAGQVVTLTVTDANGQVIQTQQVTADMNGDWTAALMMLADGAYDITATVSTAAGTVTTATTNIIIDTAAPTLTLDSPAAGDTTSTNDDTPAISGTSEPGAVVTVIITDVNGAVVQTLNPAVDMLGGWTIDAAQLPEGTYTVDATAEDSAGNTANAGPATLIVDLTAPSLSIDAPMPGQTIGTRDVPVIGTTDAGQEVVLELLDNNGAVIDTAQVIADQNGAYTATFSNVANGDYTVRATATDAAQNVTTQSVDFSVDSTEAFVEIQAPADGTALNTDAMMVTGRADVGGAVEVVIFDANGNEIARQAATPGADGTWSASFTGLADGAYRVDATSTLPSGNTATDSVNVTIDTTAPATTIDTPADGATTNNTTPTVSGTTEPGSTVSVTITDANGTVAFTGDATVNPDGTWSIPSGMLADGTYTVEATATDAAGNTSTAGPNTFTVDSTAPTLTITNPTAGGMVEGPRPTISGTADPGAMVEVTLDGQVIGTATADANGDWSLEVSEDLAPGEHTVSAKTTNDAGTTSSTGDITFTVTSSTPIVITSPTDGGEVTGPAVTVTGTGTPGSTITVTIGDKTEDVVVGEDGSWSVTIDDVPAGNTTITAEGDGKSTTVTVNVVDPVSGGFVVTGGACASTGTQGAPGNGLLLLVSMFGMVMLRRARRRMAA